MYIQGYKFLKKNTERLRLEWYVSNKIKHQLKWLEYNILVTKHYNANKIHFDSNLTKCYAPKGFGNLQTQSNLLIWKPRKA